MIDEKIDILKEAKYVLEEEMASIKGAYDVLDGNFEKAVRLIASSSKLIISGVGKSGIIARKIAGTFSSIGFPSIYMHPVDALHGDIGIVQPGDVVILLSKSGSTEDIVKLLPFLKSRGARIISIVGNTKSFLSKASDVCLDGSVQREACPLNITPTSSTTVALALGDALAVCVMKLNNITIEDFSKQHPLGQIGKNISLQVKDVMHTNSSLPIVATGVTFREALLEVTNKGLGCVCVVDNQKKLAGIITDGDVRRTLQNMDDIRQLNVKDVMTKSPVSIHPGALLGEALALMEQRNSQISVLPVIDESGGCIGVIRLHDIIRSTI